MRWEKKCSWTNIQIEINIKGSIGQGYLSYKTREKNIYSLLIFMEIKKFYAILFSPRNMELPKKREEQ